MPPLPNLKILTQIKLWLAASSLFLYLASLEAPGALSSTLLLQNRPWEHSCTPISEIKNLTVLFDNNRTYVKRHAESELGSSSSHKLRLLKMTR